jgi:hypothetical protein
MRDPNRIPKVLAAIQQVWEQSPDLRLCQLLQSLCPGKSDLFYIEDDTLLAAALQDFANKDEP